MLKSQIDPATLILAALAAAFGLTLLPGAFACLASIGGLCLLVILLGYDRDGYRSVFQSLAFAAVFSLSVTLAAAYVLKLIAGSYGEAQPTNGQFATEWLPGLWAVITVVFWPIDRARMSGRVQYGSDLMTAPVSGPIITPHFTAPPPPAPAPIPVPQRVQYVAPQPPPPQPSPQPAQQATPPPVPVQETPPSDLTAVYTQAPPQPAQYAPPPAQAPQPVQYAPPPPQPTYAPPPQPQPAQQSNPVLVRGKETMIYVTLVGEGLNLMRSVRAEHLGRDFYRIIETMPEGETWEYGPGQVVRCRKQNLSSGKAMVAYEEAPRSQ